MNNLISMRNLGEEKINSLLELASKLENDEIKSDMTGKVMGALKSKHSDALDFSKVSSIIKGILN